MATQGPDPTAAGRRGPSPRLTVLLALGVGALVGLGAIFAAVGGGGSAAQPTAAEVREIHMILHRLETTCAQSGRSPAARGQLDGDVATIVAFADTYPEARFQVDDESGSALSLLLVAREATRQCAPAASRTLDDVLPERLRTGAP